MSKEYSKVCKTCREKFVAHAHNALFCSDYCGREYPDNKKKTCGYHKRWREKNLEKEKKRAHEYHKYKMATDLFYVERKRKNARNWRRRNPDAARRNHNKLNFNGNKYIVIKRDKQKCRICGRYFPNKYNCLIAIHHIDGNRKNNELGNLLTLCDGCHKYITNFQQYKRFLERMSNRKEFIKYLANMVQ